jgi:non-ribosomal peptide synthetase component F
MPSSDPKPLGAQLDYWKKQLSGDLPVLAVSNYQQQSPRAPYRRRTQAFELPWTTSAELKALSRREHTTLYVMLLTAFKILLRRYTVGETNPLVGIPVVSRRRNGPEGVGGFFVNTLALRTDLSGTRSFLEALRRVHGVMQEAYYHKDLPLNRLVEELRAEFASAEGPLVQVTFLLKDTPKQPLGIPNLLGLAVSPAEIDEWEPGSHLTLVMEDKSTGLVGTLEYNAELLDEDTVSRMLDQYQSILLRAVARPEGIIE